MKKLWILAALVVLVALLPLVGNRVVKNTIEQRLETLSQNGLEAKLQKEERSYLKTKLHYTITVKDEKKFLSYLQSYSSKELPPYTKSLLDGVVFAVDIGFSNIPFSEKISIDLYPLKLSDVTMEDLQKNNPDLYAFLSKLLKKRALLYHIDYDVTSSEFQGHMKDLNEHFTTHDDTNVSLLFSGVAASGKGMLLAPDSLRMQVKHIAIAMSNDTDALQFDIDDLLTTNSFESPTTYITSSKVASAQIVLHTTRQDVQTSKKIIENIEAGVKNLSLSGSSDTQGKDAEFFAKISADELRFTQNAKSFLFKGFDYDSSLSGVEKESFIKLQQLIEKNSQTPNNSPQLEQELESLLVKIFAHGLEFKIADLSLAKLSTPDVQNIDGFKITLQANLKSDPTFAQNYQQNPDAFVKNLSVTSDMHFSKPFYTLLNKVYPVDLMFANYKKEQGDMIRFHIEFKNGLIMINGQRLQ